MNKDSERWVLAFDASCGTCREISDAVAHACDGRLEVLPLANADVRRWRDQALGREIDWAPTLLRVTGPRVRAWTGPVLGWRLARVLGPAATLRVMSALGRLQRQAAGKAGELPGAAPDVVSRARFFRLAAGAGVAAGLVFTGNTPAFATKGEQSAQAWVLANRANLPRGYAEVIAYPLAYRRAIYQASPPAVRSALWSAHLREYRSARPHLTTEQLDVLNRAAALAARESVFTAQGVAQLRQAEDVHRSAVAELGAHEVYQAFGMLGPIEAATTQVARYRDCECAFQHDYCGRYTCHNQPGRDNCNYLSDGCGWFWNEPCAGLCR
ncbi:bacteriocin fulvocin C-related protein [Nocardia altamirensis]|uniref:bacteriocin fulvocin C-related protein n=1 Tax=Nocardia altamirensis TaxID=472158 RepID=UPI00084008B2|nr:bacteriocin fulvocin C-related protein [Nocardia altamirensis]